jgi:bromodomain adjacent to zinc finger domain protein 1A
LDLSPFTIDEYENALYHTNPLQPCILLQEIHQTLLNVVRQDAVRGQEQVLPFKAAVPLPVDDESSDESDDEDEDKQERERLVAEQAASLAATFLDREAGGGRAGRRDWEGMLVGCLWQVCIILEKK